MPRKNGCTTPSVQNCLNCPKEKCDCMVLHMTEDEKEALKAADMYGHHSAPARYNIVKRFLEDAKRLQKT